MTNKNEQISLALINHIADGKHVTEAIDAVFGAGTAEAIINEQISLALINHIADGKHVTEAIDAVFGAGTAEAIISDVYDTLRAKYAAEAATNVSNN
jgi:late competence protein required for DNA uptake (superfamily II DNA/RNA helicase)